MFYNTFAEVGCEPCIQFAILILKQICVKHNQAEILLRGILRFVAFERLVEKWCEKGHDSDETISHPKIPILIQCPS